MVALDLPWRLPENQPNFFGRYEPDAETNAAVWGGLLVLETAKWVYPELRRKAAEELQTVLKDLRGAFSQSFQSGLEEIPGASVPMAVERYDSINRVIDPNYQVWRPTLTAGLEEGRTAQDRVRDFLGTLGKQAPNGIVPTIFGQELQKRYPSFRAFAGLEDRNIFLEDGDRPSLLAKLVAKDVREVIYVGLEEEAAAFMPMAARAGMSPRLVTPQNQQSFARLILEILAQATGLEEVAIQAQQGFQEFLTGLEELSSGA
ncbi:MAG: hypothetical protein HYZ73_04065 [Elusimicrobia bacterium]|nr:hypothetical protein [Elusimicrobiota bacterium]